jgi:hypothetical protein
VPHHLLVHGVAFVRARYHHELDLLELVLADHAAHVLAVTAGLGAEAGRVRGQPHRQRRVLDDFVAHEIGQRNLGSRDQVTPRLADRGAEQVLLELRQVAGAEQAFGIHDQRHVALGVSVFATCRSSMNCASARCIRARPPRSTVKREPDSLAPVAWSSQPWRSPSAMWSRTSKSTRAARRRA